MLRGVRPCRRGRAADRRHKVRAPVRRPGAGVVNVVSVNRHVYLERMVAEDGSPFAV
jgi:hypothetical protein